MSPMLRGYTRWWKALWLVLGATTVGVSLVLALAGAVRYRSEVWVWYPDGAVERISPTSGVYYQPHVHPDGREVVCHGGETGPPRIWRARLAEGTFEPLTPADSASFHAAYSWDGLQIVFASDRGSDIPPLRLEDMDDPRRYSRLSKDRHYRIWLMEADGSAARALTDPGYRDLRPTFSPDGQRVVFISDRAGLGSELWWVPTDGSAAPRSLGVREAGWGAWRPWFTRDGESIIFFGSRERDGEHRILRVGSNGGEVSLLEATGRGSSHGPFVDLDGETLLVHSTREGRWRIYEIGLESGSVRRLDPPGIDSAAHATRSAGGTLVFDVTVEEGLGSGRLGSIGRRLIAALERRIGR